MKLRGLDVLFRYLRITVIGLQLVRTGLAGEPVLVDLHLPLHLDPFGIDAKAQYSRAAAEACNAPKPQGFAGYRWRLPAVASEMRSLTGTSEGKQIYIGFLKSKYGYNIANLNADYGTNAQSFTELLESRMSSVDSSREVVRTHDAEFDLTIRREMVDAILSALNRCDPKHAHGGIRLLLQDAIR